jgi:hypothetical protein
MNRTFAPLPAAIRAATTALAAAGVLHASACGGPPAEPSAVSDPESLAALPATASLVALHSSKCAEVAGGSTAQNASIVQSPCRAAADEQWRLTSVASGTYTLASVNSGMCMDVAKASTSDGAPVIQWPCNGSKNQQWKIGSVASGQYRLQAVHSGKCLDVTKASTANGALFEQWTCNGGKNQTFQLTPAGGSGGDAGPPPPPPPPSPRIEAWIFPGDPACNAPNEYRDGRHIDVLKPEYYRLTDAGDLQQETVASDGCNAYSAANAADVKKYSSKQLFTVSGSGAQLAPLVASASRRAAAVSTLVGFAQQIGFSGVDIDFEGLSSSVYPGYLTFLQELGTALHAKGLELEIDVTAYANAGDQSQDAFRYEDAVPLPVDGIVVMAYDYMTDYAQDGARGAGDPIAPNAWVGQVLDWAFAKVGDKSRVVIGIPSYGYSGKTGSTDVARDTLSDLSALPGATGAKPFSTAFEQTWSSGGSSYVFVTASDLDAKRAYVVSKGATAISVWHLGGNAWFTN